MVQINMEFSQKGKGVAESEEGFFNEKDHMNTRPRE